MARRSLLQDVAVELPARCCCQLRDNKNRAAAGVFWQRTDIVITDQYVAVCYAWSTVVLVLIDP